jgi:MFS family permease
MFFVATFGMNFQVTTALMSRGVFHTGAAAFGLASAAFAGGALGGALLAARRARPGMRLMLTTALAFGVLEVAAGLMPTYWSFLALLVPTGVALLMFTTTANSATQLGTPPAVRGRVMGLYMLVFLGGAPLGSLLVGWAAEQFGVRITLIVGGVISALAAVVAALLLARVRDVPARSYLRLAAPAAFAAPGSSAPATAAPATAAPATGAASAVPATGAASAVPAVASASAAEPQTAGPRPG